MLLKQRLSVYLAPVSTRKDALESVLSEIPAVHAVKKGSAAQSSGNFAAAPYISVFTS